MRVIGYLETDKDARTFGDFLYVKGIENEAERDGERWAIWVHSDDHLSAAKEFLTEFQANPSDPKFQQGSPAEKLREQAKKQEEVYRKRVVEGRAMFPTGGRANGPVTTLLILASILVFVLSNMGDNVERLSSLLITKVEVEGNYIRWLPGLQEVRKGEVWRLISPIIIHFSVGHILFNMLWLYDLGRLFETRLRSWYFAVFVIVIAVASNYGQFLIGKSPMFGGMSGVVYALIGYVWIRGRFDPAAGMMLDRTSVTFALIWFALGFTGWVGPIANTAHAVGLIGGAAWAFIDSKRRSALKR